MTDWTALFGNELQCKDGKKSTNEVLAGKKIVGVYFSAHWCPPCRGFTPVLATVYEDMIEDHEDFEIIFVSSDRDEASFGDYYGGQPWKALPFPDREFKAQLAQKYGVRGIPMLVFLNERGEVITTEGRNIVMGVQGDIGNIWKQLTA